MIVLLTKWDGGQAHSIRVEIDEAGNVAAVVEGVSGPACSDISKFMDTLGVVTRDEPTPEFFQAAVETDTLKAWG